MIELHQAAFAARGWLRAAHWGARHSLWKPATVALICWTVSGIGHGVHQTASLTTHGARAIETACGAALGPGTPKSVCGVVHGGAPIAGLDPVPVNVNPLLGVLGFSVGVVALAATITTVMAVAVGGLRLVGAIGSSSYRRRGGFRDGIKSDWHAGQRDARQARKHLRRAGNAHARRRARRHGAGQPVGNPSRVEEVLLGHADPPKTRKEKKAGKGSARAERVELDAEWDAELRRIRATRTGHLDTPLTPEEIAAGVAVGDAMRVDAGGPADQVEAWRDVIEHPHEGPLPPAPPPTFVSAPSHATPEQAMANHHDAEALGVVLDTSHRADVDEVLR